METVESKTAEKKEVLTKKELMQKFIIRDDRTVETYIREGALPEPVEETTDGEILFDKRGILKMLGAKTLEEEFILLEDAAKILGIKESRAYQLVKQGMIPHYRLKSAKGSQILFLRSEMEAAKRFTLEWSAPFANRVGKDIAMRLIFSKLISEHLNLLSGRHREILHLMMVEGKSMSEIGRKLRLSRERVRQIFDSGIKVLHSRLDSLNEMMEKVSETVRERDVLRGRLEHYEKKQQAQDKIAALPEKVKDILFRNIFDFDFTTRSRKAFEELGVKTVKDLAVLGHADILRVRNTGKMSLYEMEDFLVRHGLRWNMKL